MHRKLATPPTTGGVYPMRLTGRRLSIRAAIAAVLVLLSGVVPGVDRSLARGQEPGQERESSPQAVTIYTDAANFQNNGAFELAAEEWDKFLDRFPEDPLAPKARHYRGVCLMQLQEFADAEEEFAKVVEDHPQFELAEDALLNLGWCRYSLAVAGDAEKFEPAAQAFRQLVQRFPRGKYLDQAYFFHAESLYSQGEREQAVPMYRKVVDDYPDSSLRRSALYALGVAYEELEQYEEARAVFDSFLEEFPGDTLATEVRMRKAETVLQAGEFQQAERMFGEVADVEGFESADYARYRQAYSVARQDRFADAAAIYAAVAEQFPDSPYAAEAAMAAGRHYYRAELFDEAGAWFSRIRENTGTEAATEAAHWQARIHLKNGRPSEALAVTDDALPDSVPDHEYHIALRMDRGDALYELDGRKADALDVYRQLAADSGDHELVPQALYNAAFTALELEAVDDAAPLVASFRERFPDHALRPDVEYVAAESHLQRQQYAEARDAFRELLQNNATHPEYDHWTVRLGLALYLNGEYGAAREHLNGAFEGLGQGDLRAEAEFLVGASWFLEDNYEEAARWLRTSVLTDARWRQADEALIFLARSQQALGQYDEAMATLGLLLQSFPQSELRGQAVYRMGEFAYETEDYDVALDSYDRVIEEFADSEYVPYAWFGKGWSRMNQGDYEAAEAAYSELLDGYADHEVANDAQFARGMARRQQGAFELARGDIVAFLETEPAQSRRSDARYELGLIQVGLERFEPAAATFRQLLEEHPEYPGAAKAWYELGWAHREAGDLDASVEAFGELASQYPEHELAAEAHFHVGERFFEREAYQEAASAYARVRQAGADGELLAKADYKRGMALFELEQFTEARDQFRRALENAPAGPLAADARFRLGESLFRLNEYQDALSVYQQSVGDEQASEAAAVLVRLHGGQSAAQLEEWDTAIEFLEPVPQNYPRSPYLAQVQYELGWAHQNLEQFDQALAAYEQAVLLSRQEVGARAQFMIGEIAFAQRRYDDAVKDFQRVMYRFGNEDIPAEIRNWQAKAGFEAARCVEVQIADQSSPARRAELIEEAKKFYTYVVEEHGDSELVPAARQRLAALARL